MQEFFVDNTDNSSIAINLIDHPGIQFFHDAIAAIEARADVQAVLVNIYDLDPIIDGGWPYAENVHILTSASEDEVQQWAAYLRSDGAMEGWPYGVPNAARKAEPGQKWWSLSWD
ncbi:hypothetical protein [Lysobacter gummosus]|uniref:hypothetical protein n=1 Tax=Lysobacter gummosus TaxID=262324 RepID=UPI00363CAC14